MAISPGMQVPPAPHHRGALLGFLLVLTPFESISPSSPQVETPMFPAAFREAEKEPFRSKFAPEGGGCPVSPGRPFLAAPPNCSKGLTSTQWVLPVAPQEQRSVFLPKTWGPRSPKPWAGFFFFPFLPSLPPDDAWLNLLGVLSFFFLFWALKHKEDKKKKKMIELCGFIFELVRVFFMCGI
uniref:Putative conserved plasma membrane protein n=1 Tax=Ixodes scapularis TaxID=6945 RepID=A0A4D5S5E7_IXOSC